MRFALLPLLLLTGCAAAVAPPCDAGETARAVGQRLVPRLFPESDIAGLVAAGGIPDASEVRETTGQGEYRLQSREGQLRFALRDVRTLELHGTRGSWRCEAQARLELKEGGTVRTRVLPITYWSELDDLRHTVAGEMRGEAGERLTF